MSMSDQRKLKIDAIHEVIILWRYLHSSYDANYLYSSFWTNFSIIRITYFWSFIVILYWTS